MIQFIHTSIFFFFNDTATTEIYTLSLHDALPIYRKWRQEQAVEDLRRPAFPEDCDGSPLSFARYFPNREEDRAKGKRTRSEEHTSELQSRPHLVCRLLLEKKKKHRDTE